MDEFLAKPIKLGALADVLHRCHATDPNEIRTRELSDAR